MGTLGSGAMNACLARRLLAEADVPFVENLPEGVEVVTRTYESQRFTFLFNNTPERVDLSWNGRVLPLSPYGMRVPEWSDEEL